MKMKEFKYKLPEEKIAKYPPKVRGTTNLLVLDRDTGDISNNKYFQIPQFIQPGDVVVLNETKVLKSRTYFVTPKGKRVEVLFLEKKGGNEKWFVLIGRAKDVALGEVLRSFDSKEFELEVLERIDNGFLVKLTKGSSEELFNKYGHTPLPPYMKREDEEMDQVRYNTVFSRSSGAVAAPTASLNVTDDMLEELKDKGVKIATVDLQVGWGTFQPIREERIEDHKIHEEKIVVSKEAVDIVNKAILGGKKVWSFGTTVARTLESVAFYDERENTYLISEYVGTTQLYIYPGYKWKIVDSLITNFHMPDSTLILLVSSFGGIEKIKKAYEYALENNYKFLSYGDSMLII